MLLETARHHPLRFAPYVAIPFILSAMLAGSHDLDDEDVDSLTNSLQKWLRDKGHVWFLPFKDANDRFQAMDFGYFMPWTMYTDVAQKAWQGKPMEALMTLGLLGSPIVDITTALQTGRDPFTQKDIWNKYDPPGVQVATIMNYVWRTAMPTWLTDIGFAGKLAEAAGGSVDKYGEPTITMAQAMARLVGVNLYSVNPQLSRAKNLMFMQSDISKTKARMTMALKDPNLTPEQRRSIARAYLSEIQDRAQEMAEYARESRITPAIAMKFNPNAA